MNAEHLEAYLADELDENARHQVERALRRDVALRESFLHQAQLHAALQVVLGAGIEAAKNEDSSGTRSAALEMAPASPTVLSDRLSFQKGVMARLRTEGAGDSHSFTKSVLTEIVEEREGIAPIRWPDLITAGLISAAATIALIFVLQGIIFPTSHLPPHTTGASSPVVYYVARVEQAKDLKWSPSTAARVRDDGWLTRGLLEMDSGEVMISFNSGASIMVEGPAVFSVESNNRVFLQSGRLTAEVPPPASGFTVNTPRLNAVDIGTRFGVQVAANGDSELHVMEGEVEASRSSGNATPILVREGLALRADGRVRNKLMPLPYAGEEFIMQIAPPSLPQPVLHYRFDETGGAVIEDSGITPSYDVPLVASGELDNSPKRTVGKHGGGLLLQPGKSLEVLLSRDFRVDEPYTISFWVKIPPKLGSYREETLLHYGRPETGWNFSCFHESLRGSGGALRVGYGNGFVIGSTDIADGNWHHVLCRFIGGTNADISSHLHLFIDGIPETISDFRPERIRPGRVAALRLGDPGEGGLDGSIDDFKIFREAVSTTRIHELSK